MCKVVIDLIASLAALHLLLVISGWVSDRHNRISDNLTLTSLTKKSLKKCDVKEF